ncbi:MAG: hypothetical protein AAF721_36230 [Myxococcota bacterium]
MTTALHNPHSVVPRFRSASAGVAGLLATAAVLAGGCRNTIADDGPPITVGGGTGGDDGGPATVGGTVDDGADTGGFDDSSWEGTAFVGEVHGLVFFTFSAGHALRANDVLGIVGGYRTSEVGWDEEDLYSSVVYFLPFEAAPASPDGTSFEAEPAGFAYGDEADWISAGNGLVLRRTDMQGSATACLQNFDVDVDGTPATYPVYATGNAGHDLCDADPTIWEGNVGYDVLLFGGETFDDNELIERVLTPPALEVLTPNFNALGEVVSAGAGIDFTWEPGDSDTRIVFRIIDSAGGVLSAHAADDGSFRIEPGDLAMLQPGSIDVLMVRQRSDRMLFTDGGLLVVSQYERWGFFELEA